MYGKERETLRMTSLLAEQRNLPVSNIELFNTFLSSRSFSSILYNKMWQTIIAPQSQWFVDLLLLGTTNQMDISQEGEGNMYSH